jgi:dTDP-4-amino-4,6-dideoxygalactose transaminase
LKIPFTEPSLGAAEVRAVVRAMRSGRTVGNGPICQRVQGRLRELTGASHVLLTPNATQAFEVFLTAAGIGPGDEVILPSFSFVSMANAVLVRGATPVFCEIDPATLNLCVKDAEQRFTDATRLVMPVHYAGIPGDLLGLAELCERRGALLFEDAAQAIGSRLLGRHLGTLGQAGCLSFHQTKNVCSGEGGALLLRDDEFFHACEIAQEKGTNRSAFLRGEVDKYTWVDRGGSYVLSDMLAALLEVQLERLGELNERRMVVWNTYARALRPAAEAGLIRLPTIPSGVEHNAHIFYFVAESPELQEQVLSTLKREGIHATFHFQPLHSSPFARAHLATADLHLPATDHAAQCIVRLPLSAELNRKKAEAIAAATLSSLGLEARVSG